MPRLLAVILAAVNLSGAFLMTPAKLPATLESAFTASLHEVEGDGAGFRATNPAQNLQLSFRDQGVEVSSPVSSVVFRFQRYGRASTVADGGPYA